MEMEATYVEMCFHSIHQEAIQPESIETPIIIKAVDPRKPAARIIKSALMSMNLNPNDANLYQLFKCNCEGVGQSSKEDLIDGKVLVANQGWDKPHQRLLLKRISAVDDPVSLVDPSPQVTAPPPVVAKRKAKELKEPSPTATASSSTSTSTSPSKPATKYKKRTKREDRVPLQWSEISIPAQARVDQINSILGGDQWKSQQIGGLGVIPSRNEHSLNGLRKCVEAGTPGFVKEDVKSKRSKKKKDPVASGSGSGNSNGNANGNGGSNGLFHEDIVEALIRAFDMRSRKERELGGGAYFELGASDFNQAAQLLEEKKKNGGKWPSTGGIENRSDLLSIQNPKDRFPLKDSGLDGRYLVGCRSICLLWKNDKWLTQAPFPGMKPISMRSSDTLVPLRQMAILTQVKDGEEIPDGYPDRILKVLREAIEFGKKNPLASRGGTSPVGWSMNRSVPYAYILLKKEMGVTDWIPANPFNKHGVTIRASRVKELKEQESQTEVGKGKGKEKEKEVGEEEQVQVDQIEDGVGDASRDESRDEIMDYLDFMESSTSNETMFQQENATMFQPEIPKKEPKVKKTSRYSKKSEEVESEEESMAAKEAVRLAREKRSAARGERFDS